MTKNAERFNKAMKRLLKADRTEQERAAVPQHNGRHFIAGVNYEKLELEYTVRKENEEKVIVENMVNAARTERKRRRRRQRTW